MRATDLEHGRGWLADGAAASIRRIDRDLGHPLQITEAGRTWAQQNVHYQTYLRIGYPIALSPDAPSVHQEGEAIDSDEAQDHLTLMTRHGWLRTVYRNNKLVEPWHFEYFAENDQHRNEDDMLTDDQAHQLQQLYNATFKGGPSMQEDGNSISASLAKLWNAVKPINRDGKPVVLRQEIADTKTKVYALEAAVTALATSQGADPAAILRAVEDGVKEAMRDVSITVDVDG